ncbi:MAG: hypothetical protein JNM63_05725 [Spirochaetia bacterium]|nr:hypothetical protein [Spirochaetia bacterium]
MNAIKETGVETGLKIRKLFVVICAWALGAGLAFSAEDKATNESHDICFQNGEACWMNQDHSNSVAWFRKAILAKPGDALAYALLCRGLFEVGELLPEKAKKERLALYEEMIRLANEGLRQNSNSGECYFMRALGVGRRSTTKGVLDSLGAAGPMERDWLKALDCHIGYTAPNGENALADTYHGLGIYYRLCPDVFLMRWLFGTMGDLKKAEDFSRKAVAIQGDRIELALELGVVLVARGLEDKNKTLTEEGKSWLRKVAELPVKKKTDEIDQRHARMLLENPKMCRDYERDGQQERDIKKAKKDALKKTS